MVCAEYAALHAEASGVHILNVPFTYCLFLVLFLSFAKSAVSFRKYHRSHEEMIDPGANRPDNHRRLNNAISG